RARRQTSGCLRTACPGGEEAGGDQARRRGQGLAGPSTRSNAPATGVLASGDVSETSPGGAATSALCHNAGPARAAPMSAHVLESSIREVTVYRRGAI